MYVQDKDECSTMMMMLMNIISKYSNHLTKTISRQEMNE
jgi:hypothetical protein